MGIFESVLDVILSSPRERDLEREVAELKAENVKLQRQLQTIRIAHEPLHQAIYPPDIRNAGHACVSP